jgi:hypothetical protein
MGRFEVSVPEGSTAFLVELRGIGTTLSMILIIPVVIQAPSDGNWVKMRESLPSFS